MIPDFPHIIKVRLAPLKIFFVVPDFAKSGHNNKKNSMGPFLFLYYEESLVSSNLNSKVLWFHSVRPNVCPIEETLFSNLCHPNMSVGMPEFEWLPIFEMTH